MKFEEIIPFLKNGGVAQRRSWNSNGLSQTQALAFSENHINFRGEFFIKINLEEGVNCRICIYKYQLDKSQYHDRYMHINYIIEQRDLIANDWEVYKTLEAYEKNFKNTELAREEINSIDKDSIINDIDKLENSIPKIFLVCKDDYCEHDHVAEDLSRIWNFIGKILNILKMMEHRKNGK